MTKENKAKRIQEKAEAIKAIDSAVKELHWVGVRSRSADRKVEEAKAALALAEVEAKAHKEESEALEADIEVKKADINSETGALVYNLSYVVSEGHEYIPQEFLITGNTVAEIKKVATAVVERYLAYNRKRVSWIKSLDGEEKYLASLDRYMKAALTLV